MSLRLESITQDGNEIAVSRRSRSRQHFLCLLPLPQGHGSLRPTDSSRISSFPRMVVGALLSSIKTNRLTIYCDKEAASASILLPPLFLLRLLTPQCKQLSIDSEYLTDSSLGLLAFLNEWFDLFNPVIRNPLDVLLSIHHKSQ